MPKLYERSEILKGKFDNPFERKQKQGKDVVMKE